MKNLFEIRLNIQQSIKNELIQKNVDIEQFSIKIINRYIKEYNEIVEEWGPYIVEGKGYKTTLYDEPKFNEAYDYIFHPQFEGVGHVSAGDYPIWQAVYREACKRAVEGSPYKLKFDHAGDKREDFFGTLVLFTNNAYWEKVNGYVPPKYR